MSKQNVDLLCELLAARGGLLQQLRGLQEESAWRQPEPGEWSVVEILQHMADTSHLALLRFRKILGGEPELAPNKPAEWAGPRAEAEQEGLLGILRRMCVTSVPLLEAVSNLSEADLAMPVIHPRRGAMTMRGLVLQIANHEREHEEQIANTRAAVEKG